jgi:hypothetical protein
MWQSHPILWDETIFASHPILWDEILFVSHPILWDEILFVSHPIGQTLFYKNFLSIKHQDNRIDIVIDVFLVHSNDFVINERRTALAPDQIDSIVFIRSKENIKFAQ